MALLDLDMGPKVEHTTLMETNPPIAKVNMRIPTDVLNELRRLAKMDQRSLNGEIVWILRAFLEEKAKTAKERSS